jgi:hypothetical protein
MKKEAMTIHIEPLLKYALTEEAVKRNSKNVNTLIAEILNEHIKKKQTDEKFLNTLSSIEDQLATISQILELMNKENGAIV